MIGVNDTSDEIFTVANAQQLAAFAASKHLAWLSMWSAARDQSAPAARQSVASPPAAASPSRQTRSPRRSAPTQPGG